LIDWFDCLPQAAGFFETVPFGYHAARIIDCNRGLPAVDRGDDHRTTGYQ